MIQEADFTDSTAGYDPEKDSVYMSPAMCNFFERKLAASRQEILEKEKRISLSQVNAPNREADFVDQGTREGLYYADFMFQEHEDHLRQEIESALQRLKDGNYGYCETTGEPIGIKRLLLVPTARYCIKVQEKIEARQKSLRVEH